MGLFVGSHFAVALLELVDAATFLLGEPEAPEVIGALGLACSASRVGPVGLRVATNLALARSRVRAARHVGRAIVVGPRLAAVALGESTSGVGELGSVATVITVRRRAGFPVLDRGDFAVGVLSLFRAEEGAELVRTLNGSHPRGKTFQHV